MAKKERKPQMQWFVTTCINGNEDTVIKNLKAKVQAMHFDEYITDAKVIKRRETIEDVYDDRNPQKLPPKNMRNTANVRWKNLGDGKFMKVKIVDRNKFPGYIYVRMIMNDDTWYAVRNAQNISGLVGSSGKGAKPIPITFQEEMLLSGECADPEYRAIVTPNAIVEMRRDTFDENGEMIDSAQPKRAAPQEPRPPQAERAEPVALKDTSKLMPEVGHVPTQDYDPLLGSGFRVGHTVTVLVSDYAGLEGRIVAIDEPKGVAVVEIDFMGKQTAAELRLSDIAPKGE